jgi:hypothetical protein
MMYGLRLLLNDINRKGNYKLQPVANANKQTGGRTQPELGETVNYFGDSEAKVRASFPARGPPFVRSTFCGIESASKVSWEKMKRDGGDLRVGFEMVMRDGVYRKSLICDMMSYALGLSAHCVRSCNPGYPITAIYILQRQVYNPSDVSPACNNTAQKETLRNRDLVGNVSESRWRQMYARVMYSIAPQENLRDTVSS